jgi:hypothetical protein
MSTTFPAGEKILSYETLELSLRHKDLLVYTAPDADFTVANVTIDRKNFKHKVPKRLIVAISYEGLE